MSLILALIIIIVLLCRTLFEKMDRAHYNREYKEFTERLEQNSVGFERYIASREETDNARNCAFSEDFRYWKGYEANEQTSIARELRKRIYNEVGIQPTREMLSCAILAQEGLVPREMMWNSYGTTKVEPRKEYWEVENKFMKWLDTELQNHGMVFQMRYVTYDNEQWLGLREESTISESVQQENTNSTGKYYWTMKQGRRHGIQMINKQYNYKARYIELG